MITKQINEKLMEMIQSYGVEETIRGMYIAHGNEDGHARQDRLSKQKLDQIQTFLNNITVNQAEN
jgi:hypothetical protein